MKRELLVATCVAAVFLGLRFYEHSREWNSAYSHYAKPFAEDDARFSRLASGCEAKANEEGYHRPGEWVKSTIELQRGVNIFEPWLRDYAYFVRIEKLSPLDTDGPPSFVELTCEFNSEHSLFFVSFPH